ncbi:MAG TPA: hypothetical protein VFW00_02670 [Rhodocyclaceae bacterium]|nr:hypothetical protein [Rhodocyclaceae bacterium]
MVVKQLPLAESPIRGYMMYGYHLGITFAHVDAWPWFFSNFVQLQCDPEQLKLADILDSSTMAKGEIHFTEGTSLYNPWLSNSAHLDAATMEAFYGSISSYIVDNIKQDFYVETFIDEYYIPVLFNGYDSHFGHRLLVFGFDESQRTFDIIGFDKKSQYKKLTCGYDELDAAFIAVLPQFPERTRLFKPAINGPQAVFDQQKFVNVLNEYLDSRNTLLNPDLRGLLKADNVLWYGLKNYDFLGQYLVAWIAGQEAGAAKTVDYRGFHVLWEHKKCMLDRLKWLIKIGYDIPESMLTEYARVVSLSDVAQSRMVMCRRGLLPFGQGHLKEIPRLLDEAKKIETGVLQDVANIVSRQRK